MADEDESAGATRLDVQLIPIVERAIAGDSALGRERKVRRS
jgi:hypothetical protein